MSGGYPPVMPTYDHTGTVDVPAADLFGYLAEPGNLPDFLPAMTEAHREGGGQVHVEAEVRGEHVEGEAWLRVDETTRTLSWGAPGEGDYHGDLRVTETEPGTSEVTIRLHTERAGGEEIQRALEDAVATLSQRAAAKTDREAADHQDGWS
ncbi:Polyketide cyclase / dehydrase and lipid transport [Amycolatopsis sp. YIM 10]|nr:Polyketide cyclase / dehydrase and lipid transport [Amycolatopsis sp. YIM 10]